jgi:hypothetical protein
MYYYFYKATVLPHNYSKEVKHHETIREADCSNRYDQRVGSDA